MDEQLRQVAGLDTRVIGTPGSAELMIVFLHGYGMRASDLTPFAHSLSIPGAAYAFPQAPMPAAIGGYTWWPIDEDARAAGIRAGARDLSGFDPPGRVRARSLIADFVAEMSIDSNRPMLLCGFSQGGMLACDCVLFDAVAVDGLALLSSSCIDLAGWNSRANRLNRLPVFLSHGRADRDLAFAAGERLRQFLTDAGALVDWEPFDGGHEIPFRVWRRFRQFARQDRRAVTIHENTRHYGTR